MAETSTVMEPAAIVESTTIMGAAAEMSPTKVSPTEAAAMTASEAASPRPSAAMHGHAQRQQENNQISLGFHDGPLVAEGQSLGK